MYRNSGELSREQLDHQSIDTGTMNEPRVGAGPDGGSTHDTPPVVPVQKKMRQRDRTASLLFLSSVTCKREREKVWLVQMASGKITRDDTNRTFRFNIRCRRRCSATKEDIVTLQICKKLTMETAVYDHTHQHIPQGVAFLQMLI